MSTAWIVIAVVGVVTVAFKAAGPVAIGRRELPARAGALLQVLAPVMLVALVVTQTFAQGESIVVDERVPGVAAAAVALWLRAHVVVAMVVAATVTALLRLAL